jgi:predicted SprT family Zn-dependent metalloprotease
MPRSEDLDDGGGGDGDGDGGDLSGEEWEQVKRDFRSALLAKPQFGELWRSMASVRTAPSTMTTSAAPKSMRDDPRNGEEDGAFFHVSSSSSCVGGCCPTASDLFLPPSLRRRPSSLLLDEEDEPHDGGNQDLSVKSSPRTNNDRHVPATMPMAMTMTMAMASVEEKERDDARLPFDQDAFEGARSPSSADLRVSPLSSERSCDSTTILFNHLDFDHPPTPQLPSLSQSQDVVCSEPPDTGSDMHSNKSGSPRLAQDAALVRTPNFSRGSNEGGGDNYPAVRVIVTDDNPDDLLPTIASELESLQLDCGDRGGRHRIPEHGGSDNELDDSLQQLPSRARSRRESEMSVNELDKDHSSSLGGADPDEHRGASEKDELSDLENSGDDFGLAGDSEYGSEFVAEGSASDSKDDASIPRIVSTRLSVETILSPMHDSTSVGMPRTTTTTTTKAAPSTTSLKKRSAVVRDKGKRIHEHRTPKVDKRSTRSVPTSIFRRPKAEAALSPLSMSPPLRLSSTERTRAGDSLAASPAFPSREATSSSSSIPLFGVGTDAKASLYDDSDDDDDFAPLQRSRGRQTKTENSKRGCNAMFDDSDSSPSPIDDDLLQVFKNDPNAAPLPRMGTSSPIDSIKELVEPMSNLRLETSSIYDEETESDAPSASPTSDRKMSAADAKRLSAANLPSGLGLDLRSSDDSDDDSISTSNWKELSPCLSPRIVQLLEDSMRDEATTESDASEIERKTPSAMSLRDPASMSHKKQVLDSELLSSRSSSRVSSTTSKTDTDNEEPWTSKARHVRPAESTEFSISSPKVESSDESVSRFTSIISRKGKAKLEQMPRTLSQASSSARGFLRNRKALAQQLFLEYDRVVFGGALSSGGACTIQWSNRLTTTAGATAMPMNSRTAKVSLSSKLLDRESRLRCTLMHELCHAAAWIVDGVNSPPHGKAFRRWGDRAERLVPGIKVSTTHTYEIEHKHAWKCKNQACGQVYRRMKRIIDVNRHCCGVCKGRLSEIVNQQRVTEEASIPKPKAPLTAYQRFVQEQAPIVRRQLEAQASAKVVLYPSAGNRSASTPKTTAQAPGTAKVSQSEVMKECARLWQAQKKASEQKK